MPDDSEHKGLREATALSELDQVTALQVTGEDTFDALDKLVSADLFIRDGQMLHTLMLHPDEFPLADVYESARAAWREQQETE